jgi:plasmid stability protein
MCSALSHVLRMSKMIQIRNVPDELHRELKVRAAKAGMSLSEFLLREVAKVAEKPTLEEVLERIRQREPVELDEDPVETIRKLRGPMP